MATFDWGPEKYGLKLVIDAPCPEWGDNPVALDEEDDEKGTFVGCGLYPGGDTVYYYTKPTFNLPKKINAQNGNTDLHKLKKWGFPVTGEHLFFDTQIAAYALDSTSDVGLKDQAEALLGIKYPTYKEIVGKGRSKRTLDKQPIDLVAAYNAMDCFTTYRLYEHYKSRMPSYFKLDMRLAHALFRMEERGVRIDQTKLQVHKHTFEGKRERLLDRITSVLGPINLDSPKQLLQALQAIGIEPRFKGKPSTDKRALSKFADEPIVKLLEEYSQVSTLLESFIYKYEAYGDSVVNPWFNQCRTRTSRLACKNPNLQQIPTKTDDGRLVRELFIPTREGYSFWDADFGQIEPRLMAHLSGDETMIGMFNDGIDFHDFTSARLNIERNQAKVLNLSVGYRATKFSVSKQLDCELWTAQREINKWWSMFPRLAEWEEEIITAARKEGFVTSLLGRKVPIEGLESENMFEREHAERLCINNLIQASAAEVNKLALTALDDNGAELNISVHDEILGELCNPIDTVITSCYTDYMEGCADLQVPLVIDMGTGANWAEAKS